ncbi:MAG: zinc-dependent metalloprotease [Planctomycetota bacterium]
MTTKMLTHKLAAAVTLGLATLPLAAQDSKLQDFAKVVEGMQRAPDVPSKEGLFNLYYKDGRLLAELPRPVMDRPLLMISTLASGLGKGWLLSGMPIDEWVVKFVPGEDKVYLLRENPRFVASKGEALKKAVKMGYPKSILAVLPLLSRSPKGGMVVDLTGWLLRDPHDLARQVSKDFQGAYRFDPSRTTVDYCKAFGQNVEVRVDCAYSGQSQEQVYTSGDARYMTLAVHTSFRILPPPGSYRPRLADDRVGYFLTAKRDFARMQQLSSWVRYINRWKLEKADPTAKVSPPKEPIIFWIENTVPIEWRKAVREGALGWNKAFAEAGFVNAIEVRQQLSDDQFDPEDASYNSLRWITSHESTFGAIGPSRVDPYTGQILDADILFEESLMRGFWFEYQFQIPAYDPKASMAEVLAISTAESLGQDHKLRAYCTQGMHRSQEITLMHMLSGMLPDPSEGVQPVDLADATPARKVPFTYLEQALRETVMHEVGHTLGLRHNFKASTLHDGKEINDAEKTAKEGLVGSVMDYNAINIAPEGETQGEYYASCVGPYDVWAIRYGYTPIDAPAPEAELPKLLEIASEAGKPGNAYGTDEDALHYMPFGAGVDPDCNAWDIGDVSEFAEERMQLVAKLLPEVADRLVRPGEGHQFERIGVSVLLGQAASGCRFMAKKIGGVRVSRVHKGDPGVERPMDPVPPDEQREALAFLLENCFASKPYRLPADQLARMTPWRWNHWGMQLDGPIEWSLVDQVKGFQTSVLYQLFHPLVLDRIVEGELMVPQGQTAFTVAELFRGLREGVFSEVAAGQDVDVFRRNLQRAYVEVLLTLATEDVGAVVPHDALAAARANLMELYSSLAGLQAGNLGETTRVHYQDLVRRMKQALDATRIQQG